MSQPTVTSLTRRRAPIKALMRRAQTAGEACAVLAKRRPQGGARRRPLPRLLRNGAAWTTPSHLWNTPSHLRNTPSRLPSVLLLNVCHIDKLGLSYSVISKRAHCHRVHINTGWNTRNTQYMIARYSFEWLGGDNFK